MSNITCHSDGIAEFIPSSQGITRNDATCHCERNKVERSNPMENTRDCFGRLSSLAMTIKKRAIFLLPVIVL